MSRANWRSLGKQRDAVSKVCDFIRGMERELFQGAEMDRHRTSRPAGRFHGPMVVTMRPIPEAQVQLAGEVTGRYAHAHGAPLHAGSPETIGIADLGRPDYGDPVAIHPGEVAGLLGLRGDATSGRTRGTPRTHDHPRAGDHVPHRLAPRGRQPVVSGSGAGPAS